MLSKEDAREAARAARSWPPSCARYWLKVGDRTSGDEVHAAEVLRQEPSYAEYG